MDLAQLRGLPGRNQRERRLGNLPECKPILPKDRRSFKEYQAEAPARKVLTFFGGHHLFHGCLFQLRIFLVRLRWASDLRSVCTFSVWHYAVLFVIRFFASFFRSTASIFLGSPATAASFFCLGEYLEYGIAYPFKISASALRAPPFPVAALRSRPIAH
jgi:hypothetical protein